ncbi:MAG: S8 family peptidase [Burkholderiaceae bacterium]
MNPARRGQDGTGRRAVDGGSVAWTALLLAGLLTLGHPTQAREALADEPLPARGLLVKLLPVAGAQTKADALRLQQALAAAGVAPKRTRAVGRAAQHLDFERVLDAAEAADLAQRLRRQPEVEWVVPNTREQRLEAPIRPNDPLYASQWWLHPVAGSNANVLADRRRGVPGFETAWAALGAGKPAAVVALLDTGITAHPDLDLDRGLLRGYDFVSDPKYANDGDGRDDDPSDPGDWVSQDDRSADPARFGNCAISDSHWHGTVIAGILAASTGNALGVAGATGSRRVLPVRVGGKCGAELADIVDGLRWAAGLEVAGVPRNPHPARVINLSFGGKASCNAAYQDTIDELAGLGAVVVAAAGNVHGSITRPANCARVIGVAALNRDGFKASYSNFGPGLAIATVGGDAGDGAWSALLGDGGLLSLQNAGTREPGAPSYASVSGTSFAAPIVAATVSLMLGVNPKLTAAQVIAGLTASARPHVVSSRIGGCSDLNPGRCICSTGTCGAGLLDVVQALVYADDPTGYQPVHWPLVDLDSAAEVASAAVLGLDRSANAAVLDEAAVASAAAGGSGAGGGAFDGWALAVIAAAGWALRRASRRSSRRR